MAVYIRQAPFPIESTVNKYNVRVGAYLRGAEAIMYTSFAEIDCLTCDDVVVDYMDATEALLQAMDVLPEALDYPEELRAFLGRRVRAAVMGDINAQWDGTFVKPRAGTKAFTGRVLHSAKDLVGLLAEPTIRSGSAIRCIFCMNGVCLSSMDRCWISRATVGIIITTMMRI